MDHEGGKPIVQHRMLAYNNKDELISEDATGVQGRITLLSPGIPIALTEQSSKRQLPGRQSNKRWLNIKELPIKMSRHHGLANQAPVPVSVSNLSIRIQPAS